VLKEWLDTFQSTTKKNYKSSINQLTVRGLVNPQLSMQAFALVNHEATIDKIKQIKEWSEGTKQVRAACYISLTRYLERRTQGVIRRAIPCREGNNKTFFKVREKVATKAMANSQ